MARVMPLEEAGEKVILEGGDNGQKTRLQLP